MTDRWLTRCGVGDVLRGPNGYFARCVGETDTELIVRSVGPRPEAGHYLTVVDGWFGRLWIRAWMRYVEFLRWAKTINNDYCKRLL